MFAKHSTESRQAHAKLVPSKALFLPSMLLHPILVWRKPACARQAIAPSIPYIILRGGILEKNWRSLEPRRIRPGSLEPRQIPAGQSHVELYHVICCSIFESYQVMFCVPDRPANRPTTRPTDRRRRRRTTTNNSDGRQRPTDPPTKRPTSAVFSIPHIVLFGPLVNPYRNR